jgi:hypothetical protein
MPRPRPNKNQTSEETLNARGEAVSIPRRKGTVFHAKGRRFEIVAYTPAGASDFLLVPVLNGVFLGPGVRRGDAAFEAMWEACDENPRWLFGKKPDKTK